MSKLTFIMVLGMVEVVAGRYMSITEDLEVRFYEGAFEQLLIALGIDATNSIQATNEIIGFLSKNGYEEKTKERETEKDGVLIIETIIYWAKKCKNVKELINEANRLRNKSIEIVNKYLKSS